MKKKPLLISTVAMAAVFLIVNIHLSAGPVFVVGGRPHEQITAEPGNQMTLVGADTTFSVTSRYGWTYQWLHKGVPIGGQTNSTLTLANVQSDDAGFYLCMVNTGREVVSSSEATLLVYVVLDPDPIFVVFGQPIVSSGGSGSCPGPYKGYVTYTLTNTWGWTPSTNTTIYTATDTNRTNTKVEYVGNYGDNGCAKTSVTIPYPTYSPVYAFAIYFTNSVPTTNYPITLIGFDP